MYIYILSYVYAYIWIFVLVADVFVELCPSGRCVFMFVGVLLLFFFTLVLCLFVPLLCDYRRYSSEKELT